MKSITSKFCSVIKPASSYCELHTMVKSDIYDCLVIIVLTFVASYVIIVDK